MENIYYFISEKGVKNGPFSLQELRQRKIFEDDLIWRSDNNTWKKASEFGELNDNIIKRPPLTPKEYAISKSKNKYFKKTLPRLLIYYVVISSLIGIISFSIANNSWEDYVSEQGGVGMSGEPGDSPGYADFGFSLQRATQRYLDVSWGNTSFQLGGENEASNAYDEGFLFRPFRIFGSRIFLTPQEQNNSTVFFFNLILSSFCSLIIIFLPIGVIAYLINYNLSRSEKM